MNHRPLGCVSVAMTRYNEPDWVIAQALLSLHLQDGVRLEVLLLDQSPSATLAELCAALSRPGKMTLHYSTIPPNGLSFARNCAIQRCETDIVLFLDADAYALPGWAATLTQALHEPATAIAGCRILPVWHGQPLLASRSRLVQDQYSIYDLGPGRQAVGRVVGAGFGMHYGRLGALAAFDESLGRKGGRLISGEESELCRRVQQAGFEIVYDGAAVIHHNIFADRSCGRWLRRRVFHAGIQRARLGGGPQPSHRLALRDYLVLPLILPHYLAGYLAGKRASREQPK